MTNKQLIIILGIAIFIAALFILNASDSDVSSDIEIIADSASNKTIENTEPDTPSPVIFEEQPLSVPNVKDELTVATKELETTVTENVDQIVEQIPLTPKQIGNRPRELGHVVTTIPPFDGSYISNYQVTTGFVPKLFRNAGFREGDVLKAINDIDISDPEDFKRADASIANADTLKFSVIRNGRPVTLFLDIPAETLKISR